MKPLPTPLRRGLIRAAYLCPLVFGILLLLLFAVPHLYFIYGNQAYDTWSTFGILGNAMKECTAVLNGTAEGTSDAVYFAYTVSFCAIVFWVALVAYLITAVAAAVCSLYAFSKEPTSKESNRAKRWFRFLCPNRVTYVTSNLALLLSAAFPHILLYCYHHQMGYVGISLHFYFGADLLYASLLVGISVISYLALLPAQADEHLDLFRLYKAK
ncbi:MAG: hypothetical protein IJF33_05780 [Clostridia bacterium]|nr:hypothetical protein [Clostridia bacterium]